MNEFELLLRAVLDSNGIGEDDIKKIEKLIDKYSVNIKTKVDKKSLTSSFKAMWSEIAPLIEKKHGIKLPVELDDALIDKSLNKVYTDIDRATAKANKIQLSIDNGSYESQIEKVVASSSRWSIENKKIETSIEEVRTAYDALINAKDNDTRIVNEEKFQQVLKKSKNLIDIQKTQFATDDEMSKLLKKYTDFYDKNTKSHRDWGKELKLGMHELSTSVNLPREALEKLRLQLEGIESSARAAGKLGYSAFDKLKNAWSKFGGWGIASGSMMLLVNQLRKIPQEVIKVNSAMIKLTKVSDATATQLGDAFNDSADAAKNLGATISDVISATADFSRLGYNLPDSKELAKIAILYKNVGDGIDISDSSSSIISTMKAFDIEASDSISIIDKFNEVGNKFSISSGEIGEALKRSGSSLSVANNSLSESIGLITAGNTVVQDAETVGTALKTVSLRITSTSAQLEELGEDTEYACETLSDYRNLVMGLTHNKADILGDDGQYKSTYEILKDISAEWKNMNSMEQSSLMKALFGVRQANIGASILENFDVAEKAMQSAEQSAGSALKEQEAYEKGIQYSLDRTAASFQVLANTILDSNLLKGIVDFGDGAINVLNNIIDSVGLLIPLLSGTSITAFVKNFDWFCNKNYLKIA